mgnify:CR=1 FL=1
MTNACRTLHFIQSDQTTISVLYLLYNLLSERSKCQARQLEMLQSEWNADDSDAKQHPECQMREADPPTSIQMIFINTLRHPPSPGQLRISRPKGQRASIDNFKVWKPKGMPTIVIISNRLETIYSTQIRNPPQISQIILSSKFIRQI